MVRSNLDTARLSSRIGDWQEPLYLTGDPVGVIGNDDDDDDDDGCVFHGV